MGPGRSSPWIVGPRNPRARTTLICFPAAGAGAHAFAHWPDHLPSWIDVEAVELPGRGRRLGEMPRTDLAALVSELADAVAPTLDRPFALFGHSMGALLAFEFARWLHAAAGRLPTQVIVTGRRAPHLLRRVAPTYLLSRDEFLAELKALGGPSSQLLEHPEVAALLVPVVRADFEAVQTYQYVPAPALPCALTAYAGASDPGATPDEVGLWNSHTTGEFRLRVFDGGHFFLHEHPDEFFRALTEDLQLSNLAVSI